MKYLFVILVSMTVFFAVINGLNDVSRHRRGILDMIFIKTRCFCKCGYPTQPPGVGTGNKLNLYFGDDKIQQNHINAENTYTDVLYEQRVRNSSIVTKGEIVVYNDELCKFNGTKQVKVDGEEYLVKNTECNTKSSDSTNTKPQDGTSSNKEDKKTVIDNENKEKGADRKEKFLNGDKSAPGEATWNVIMIIKSLPAAGGALLTDRHVITAATPLINVAEVDVKVSLGVYDRCAADLTSTNMSVQAIHLHPSYTRHDRAHDLAIVKLKNMVFFNSMIHPICLPANAMSFSGQVATVVSWLSPGYSHGHSHGHYPGYPPGNYPEHPHGHYPGHPPGYYPGYPHGYYPGHPHTHIPEHTTGYTTESSTRPTWSTGHPTESSTRPTWSTGHPTESSTRPTWSTGHTTESSTRPTWSTGHTTESSTRPTWSTEHTTESSTRPTWSTGHTTESSTRPTWSTGHTTESSTRPTWSTGHTTESSTRPTWSTGQTSERTTSERTTSERTTSQRTTSERTTSERYTKSTSRPTEPTSDISVDNIQLRMNSWDPHSMPAHSSEPHCRPRRIHQPVMTRDECSRALSSPIYLSRDKSCLGVFGSLGVFCSGDVGTPIHFLNSNNRYELLGILTDINRCDVVNPALFIRVWDHLAWITKMTHSGCSCKL